MNKQARSQGFNSEGGLHECVHASLVPRRSKNRRERLVHTVHACTKSPWSPVYYLLLALILKSDCQVKSMFNKFVLHFVAY